METLARSTAFLTAAATFAAGTGVPCPPSDSPLSFLTAAPVATFAAGSGVTCPSSDIIHQPGTGSGLYLRDCTSLLSEFNERAPDFHYKKSDADSDRPDARLPSAHLANIRQVFNPAVSDLAEAFGVSRQAVYKWLSGDTSPEEDRLELIVALSQAADAFKEAGVMHPSSFLKMRAFEGRSMLDLIAEGRLSQEQHVKVLIHEARARDEAYQRSGLAERRNSPVTDAWLSELSIPGAIE